MTFYCFLEIQRYVTVCTVFIAVFSVNRQPGFQPLEAKKLKSRTTKRRKFSTSSTFRDRAKNNGKHDNLWEQSWTVYDVYVISWQAVITHVLNVIKHGLSLIYHSIHCDTAIHLLVTTDTTRNTLVTDLNRKSPVTGNTKKGFHRTWKSKKSSMAPFFATQR